METKICEYCNKEYTTYKKTKRFCSKPCYSNWRKENHIPMKEEQKKLLSERQKEWWSLNRNKSFAGNTGKKLSEATKEKMRQAKLGKKRNITEEHREKLRIAINKAREVAMIIAANKPKRYCIDCGIELKRYSKNERCAVCSRRFRKQYRIDNGLNKSKEYHLIREGKEFNDWRLSVFAKDNYTCQKCGQVGFSLHPHHIVNFAENKELRFDINNGITLCVKCHRKYHKEYGLLGGNKEKIDSFLKTV